MNDQVLNNGVDMSNYGKYQIENEMTKSLFYVDESQLENRDLVTFKNGATYEGQWLGNMKHGHGTQ